MHAGAFVRDAAPADAAVDVCVRVLCVWAPHATCSEDDAIQLRAVPVPADRGSQRTREAFGQAGARAAGPPPVLQCATLCMLCYATLCSVLCFKCIQASEWPALATSVCVTINRQPCSGFHMEAQQIPFLGLISPGRLSLCGARGRWAQVGARVRYVCELPVLCAHMLGAGCHRSFTAMDWMRRSRSSYGWRPRRSRMQHGRLARRKTLREASGTCRGVPAEGSSMRRRGTSSPLGSCDPHCL